MDIIEFIRKFPDNNTCFEYLSKIQPENGIEVTQCRNVENCRIKSACYTKYSVDENQMSAIEGVLDENSLLPLKYWFILIFIQSSSFDKFYKIPDVKGIADKRYHDRIELALRCLNQIKENSALDLNFDELLFCCLNFKNYAIPDKL